MKKRLKQILPLILIVMSFISYGQSLTIATWNIEHLGSNGRGFPEFGENAFDRRTNDDYDKIAVLIRDNLSLEIVCAQEISSSYKEAGISYSNELENITKVLGADWKYYLANFRGGNTSEDEMQNAFIYNSNKVELKEVFELNVPDYYIGNKKAFDRKPLIGYFVPKDSDNGFVIVNLHLASGQSNDENHMAAMIMIEQNLGYYLRKNGIDKSEKDIIILGDLNDNPFKLKSNSKCCKYSNLMYEYMGEKGYTNLVDKTFG